LSKNTNKGFSLVKLALKKRQYAITNMDGFTHFWNKKIKYSNRSKACDKKVSEICLVEVALYVLLPQAKVPAVEE